MSTSKFNTAFETTLMDLLDGLDFQPPMLQANTVPDPLMYNTEPDPIMYNTEPDPLMYLLDGLDFQPPIIQDNAENSRESQKWNHATECEETCGTTDVSYHSDSTIPSGCG
jgi:hypothetical protein